MTYKLKRLSGKLVFVTDKNVYSVKSIIRERMESQCISVDKLAELTGIGRDTLFRFFSKDQQLGYGKLLLIFDALGIDVKLKA